MSAAAPIPQSIGQVESFVELDKKLREDMGALALLPYDFVMYSWPWRRKGTFLEHFDGPDDWAKGFLLDLADEIQDRDFNGHDAVEPVRMAVGSGHGVGKSALVAWLSFFIMATRPFSKGVCTASTGPQLNTKTVPEVAKWHRLFIAAHWFKLYPSPGSMKLVHRDLKKAVDWRIDFITARPENADSFQGLHAAHSTPWVMMDESSGVDDKLAEVAEGGLTDGEPMIFKFGNRTQNTGHFNDCWGDLSHRYLTRIVDSSKVKITNKVIISQWAQDYGEDSDFYRVRVLGLPPRSASTQFIPSDYVEAARLNPAVAGIREPLIMGVDVARHGGDFSVIAFRKGRDARTHKSIREEYTANLEYFGDLIIEKIVELGVDMTFIDEGGPGAGVIDHIRARGYGSRIQAINFGGKSPEPRMYFNMRAYMWGRLRDWLRLGAIDPDDKNLRNQLVAQEYMTNKKTRTLQLIAKEDMKKAGIDSPDDGDAHALTHAGSVAPREDAGREGYAVLKKASSRKHRRKLEVH